MASSSSSSSPEISHAPSALDASFFARASLDEVMEELSTRFIMNLPDQELASIERISFQVEQAHWYYEDFIREANPKLPSMQLKRFSLIFFNSCPLLRKWSSAHEEIFESFMSYKVTVPVCGAILINDTWDKCLLVKGWKSSAGWGFPKGKINQGEPARACAAREVEEEIGFQISNLINEQYIAEQNIRGQRVTLFMVPNVPEDYPFQTHTRKEISKIEWFNVTDLPGWKRKQVAGKFYLVHPFMNTLKEFITVNKPAHVRHSKRVRTKRENGDTKRKDDVKNGVPMAVNLDRDTNGYSSSSAENGEPYTPSPQSAEAIPVSTSADEEDISLQAIDPHFARLLSGLSLSASKPSLNSDIRPISVTPTSATNTSASKDSASRHSPRGTVEDRARAAAANNSPLITTLLNMKSPTDSMSSERTVPASMSAKGVQPTPVDQPAVSPVAENKFLKHLALLESVAQESAAKTPVPTAPPSFNPPASSSLVPPHLLGLEAHGSFIPVHSATSRPPAHPFPPHFNGLNGLRPMTSLSFAPQPPPPSGVRHDPSVSMHQGNLLSILGSPRAQLPQLNGAMPPLSPSPAHPMPMGGHIPPGYLSPRTFGMSDSQSLPMLRQQQSQTFFPHPPAIAAGLRAPQIPLNIPPHPLSAPLPHQMPAPPPPPPITPLFMGAGVGMSMNVLPPGPPPAPGQGNLLGALGVNANPNPMRAPPLNAGHLLSLLNGNTNVTRSASNLFSGPMRPSAGRNNPASL